MGRAPWGERAWALLGLVGVVALVVWGVRAVASIEFDELFEEELPYSLCPDTRAGGEATVPSRMTEEAADYRGSGPHRVLLDQRIGPDPPPSVTDGLPEKWKPARYDSSGAVRLDMVALVACGYQHAVGDEGTLRVCPYREVGTGAAFTVEIVSARYTYRVHEAATGRQLTSFEVEGRSEGCQKILHSSGPVCPSGSTDCNRGSSDAAPVDLAELERRLRPLVQRDAP